MKVFTAILFWLKYWKISIHLHAPPGRPAQLMKILIELLSAERVEALSRYKIAATNYRLNIPSKHRLLLVVMKGKVKNVCWPIHLNNWIFLREPEEGISAWRKSAASDWFICVSRPSSAILRHRPSQKQAKPTMLRFISLGGIFNSISMVAGILYCLHPGRWVFAHWFGIG